MLLGRITPCLGICLLNWHISRKRPWAQQFSWGVILTRDEDFDCEGVTTVTSVEEALAWFEQQDKDLYIAGGAGVYKAFDGHYDAFIKTTIEADLEGDTYFPQLDMTAFKVVSHERVAKDDKNAYDFSISRYEKEGD